ncbi:hypothetical protein [Maricaulis sp.]|uniref:hypothetical protein n=1 Tax=unclassified Maricaulis TaxID=2632371 RepID=UPI001B155E55|nr:hypothetical protein [Maricaulis sp.]MBO6797333.1 hypothetical protein [Maricaulis sp.]
MFTRLASNNTIFLTGVFLLVLQTLYGLYWAWHDISARLGLWQDEAVAQEFLASLTFTQEFFFFSHVTLNIIALLLLLRRSRFVLPVFVVSFLFDRIDWVMMTNHTLFNNLFDGSGLTMASFTVQALIITVLTILTFDIGTDPSDDRRA